MVDFGAKGASKPPSPRHQRSGLKTEIDRESVQLPALVQDSAMQIPNARTEGMPPRARIIQTRVLTFFVLPAAVVNVAYVVMALHTAERETALAAVKPWLCVVFMATSR